MEKVNLVRNARKAFSNGLGYKTISQRLKTAEEEFHALTGEISKVTADPNLKNALSSSVKEAVHVREVTQLFDKSHHKLVQRWKHFKEHEEPAIMQCQMFKSYVDPSVATALAGTLFGAMAYEEHLNGKYQALEKKLSAETAK